MEIIDTDFLEHVEGNYLIESYIEEVIEDNRDCGAWFNLGYRYSEIGKNELALRCYEILLMLDPGNIAGWNNLGNIYMDQKNYAKSIQHFEKAISYNAKYAKGHSNLGRVYAALDDMHQAIACFERAVELDPEYASACVKLGFYYTKCGHPEKGFDAASRAISLGELPISYLNKGHVHLIRGEEALAVQDYVFSKRAFADDVAFWKDYDSDFEILEQYNIDPAFYEALKSQVVAKESNLPGYGIPEIAGKWAHCRTLYNKPLTEEESRIYKSLGYPDSYLYWLRIWNASYYSYNLVQFDQSYCGFSLKSSEAINYMRADDTYDLLFNNGFLVFAEDYHSAISVFDKNGKVFQILAETYDQLNETSQKITYEDFDGMHFESFESFITHHFELTRLPEPNLDFLQNIEGDEEVMKRKRQVGGLPENCAGWNLLGKALYQVEQQELAFRCFLISLGLKPAYHPAHDSLGMYLAVKGDFEFARKHFRRAIELEEDNADYQTHLGDVYKQEGDLAKAEACYAKAKRLEDMGGE